MINIVLFSQQLNCFTDSTEVVLSKQSRTPTFTAVMLDDDSTEAKLCEDLLKQSFVIQLDFEGFIYTYPVQLQLSPSMTITFPCSDIFCNAAFTATSASFIITFPDTNTILQDQISVFKIALYNRFECVSGTFLTYDAGPAQQFHVESEYGACKIPFKQNDFATVSVFVYPNFKLTTKYQLSSITNLGDFFILNEFHCLIQFTGTDRNICQSILKWFSTHVSNTINVTWSFPAYIPDANGVYSRKTEYHIFRQVKTVTTFFTETFDCYENEKNATIFNTLIRVSMKINGAASYCLKPSNVLVGTTNKLLTILQVTDSDENVVLLYFTGSVFSFTDTQLWLDCSIEADGESLCKQKLATIKAMNNPVGVIQWQFMLDDTLVKKVSQEINISPTIHESPIISMNTSHLCIQTTNSGEITDFYQVSVVLMLGAPQYEPTKHAELFEIHGQIYYPGNYTPKQYGTYCMDYILTDKALYQKFSTNQSVSGVINFVGVHLAVEKINFISETKPVGYLFLLPVVFVSLSVIWYFVDVRLNPL
ncbi:Conserved_hypothetical protein [Hexamita inflata]|uniref:Uncharacterized protein n=1 Tax=Hexamita inflata TaxID=28002 RepID=A0AA86PZY6_9EUKA|nr:Conserved hypothetical protein [Hexamita inflata]